MENRASSPDCHACIGLRASSLALIDQQQVPSANLELRTAGSELGPEPSVTVPHLYAVLESTRP